MSLFPAYAETGDKETENKKDDQSWLENSSFQVDTTVLNKPCETGDHSDASTKLVVLNEECQHGVLNQNYAKKITRKREKKHKSNRKHKLAKKDDHSDVQDSEYFIIDTNKTREYLKVDTIARPAAPKYDIKYYLSSTRKRRKRKFKRYFQVVLDKNVNKSNSEDETVLTKQNLNDSSISTNKDEHFTGFREEQWLSQKIANYNRSVTEEPENIKIWLEYVEFQDTVYQFEKSYRKGSIAKAQRVLAEKKLSILDKALILNPQCELLLRERLKIAVSAFPSDELQEQLRHLVEKDKGNIILWQGYIEASQCSMSHCNTPSVVGLYSKCLSTLHKLRRNTTLEKYLLEESILRMLYQCGLFLKQAGLFEQLWTLLRMYLELNLSHNDRTKFNISSGFKEKQLVELEEVIFQSELPLHELWLRTEKLRESCHWLPYLEDDECEDPQRLVFTDDVVELIHPITTPENIFKLTATVFSLLKIPLLPCRHTTMQDLGLDYVPWSLDSVEPLLPLFFPLFPIDISNENLLNDNRFTVGPQYLKLLPGQEEYLDFILTVMQNCADCLTGDDKVSINVWKFRFLRLLAILSKIKRFKMTELFKRRMKKDIKVFLQQSENRQNEIFYIEYALIEDELGDREKCTAILSTALSMNTNSSIVTKNWDQSQATKCYLFRMLVQITLDIDKSVETSKNECLKYLCQLVLNRKIDVLTEESLKETESKYKFTTLQLLCNDVEKRPPLNNFLPDFLTDWLICHGWFVYLTKGPIECGVFLERTLARLEEKNKNQLWQKEVLYEFYVAVLFKHCSEQPGSGVFKILDVVLHRALENYPNNLFLLVVLAKEQSLIHSVGQQWWKIQDLLLKSGRAFSVIFSVIIANQRMLQLQEMLIDSVTGEKYEIGTGVKNRILSLYKKITKSTMCTRRCGLVWRLYLQFVYNYFSPILCRNVYYSAVEECPWLKALYIDAAIYIPAELPQIQDLIIEKQLRLHVTPEELEVLRS